MIYIQLFLGFMYIGVLAFGGGYAALPLIQHTCVEQNGWLSMTEFSDLLTISQITPGPIAINSASFVGMKAAGFAGSVVASLGFMLPPFIIVSVLYLLFKKYGQLSFMQDVLSGLKPGVTALIAVAGVDVLAEALWGQSAVTLAGTDLFCAVLALLAFLTLRKTRLGALKTIICCGILGVAYHAVEVFVL